MKKRTKEQEEFDLTTHGWAFASKQMLQGYLSRAEAAYNAIGSHDPERFKRLEAIRKAAASERFNDDFIQ